MPTATALPSFYRPPLVETVTSVQFNALSGLNSAMLALFWHRELRSEYPKATDAQPVELEPEAFGDGPIPQPVSFIRIGNASGVRLMMESAGEDLCVQAQGNRLSFNWRKTKDGEYPRWNNTLPKFKGAYHALVRFVADNALGTIKPNRWDISYVNYFVKGEEWEWPSDWPKLVPGLSALPGDIADQVPKSVNVTSHFELAHRAGRLRMDLTHLVRPFQDRAEAEILRLQLLARGPVPDGSEEGLLEGLAVGRSAIVRTFVAVTSKQAHERWGIRQ
jgi:uncharacterized protein (TIGR04255 family)